MLFVPRKYDTTQTAETPCESTVAMPAPTTPQWKTKRKSQARNTFKSTPMSMVHMAVRVLPSARITEFSPYPVICSAVPRMMIQR